MKLRIHYHQSNKRLALTKINQSVRNIFSNCHQPPTRRNTYFTQNRAYSCPTVWTLISNPPSGESDVKPQTTNTSKPYDFQLEPSCPSLKLVIPESYLSDKTSSPSSVITRDRDRSDQKNAPGLIPNLTHFINDHFPPPTDRNRNHLSPPVKEVPQLFLKRNLEPDQIAIFKTLSTAQKNRISAKPNQPLEFLEVCKEIKESDIIQLQKDLKGSDMKKRNRAQYLLIDFHSDEVKKNILDSINDVLKEDSDDVVPTTDSASKLHAFDPFSERRKKWQERKQFKRNRFARTSRTRSTIGQKVLSQTNMTTATTRRGQHHKALLSLCRIRKWPCLIRPALPNLIQLGKNLLSKNRFESDHFCSNYGFIDLTNIGPRLIYIYSCDLHSAPPKHGILILNG